MIYFVSDIHLGYYERHKDRLLEDQFIGFLCEIEPVCTELILLGDIFDFWFEYKTVIPRYFYRTLSVFDRFVRRGVKIEYLMGNHDFGHNNFFAEEFGINIIKEDISHEYSGKQFYLSHGDGKSYNDNGYLLLKRVLRNPICQRLYSALHPDCGIGLAARSSRVSRGTRHKKNYGESDGMLDFAKQKVASGYDYVIMGHRHVAEDTVITRANGTFGHYVNLGGWLHAPHYGVFDGNTFELRVFNAAPQPPSIKTSLDS